MTLHGIEWVELEFPDVNVNVPENINSRTLNIAYKPR